MGLIVLSPTVWVDVMHRHEKAVIEKQIKDFETVSKQKIEAFEKQKAAGGGNPVQIDEAITTEKALADARERELSAAMPKAIVQMRNPAVISMGFSFLVAILVSLITTGKDVQTKFKGQKIRLYLGIGS